MQELLGAEYEEYLKSFDAPHYAGLRVNTLKITPEEFLKKTIMDLTEIPWTKKGFYYTSSEQPAKHPYYYAGLYYIQEPSAMTPATLLPIEEGDRVLDLCAAPGGKTTELASKLNGTGVLVTNDISNSRAKALLKNVELSGVKNSIVVSESPEKLVKYFEGYFDKILVDAPCSGEGMFRKDAAMVKTWEEYGVEYYQNIQRQIILQAATMLRPGGQLLYSTCTFSPEENEGTIQYLLHHNPEFQVLPLIKEYGFEDGHPEWIEGGSTQLTHCVRIWPHKVNGEGHFVALLQKGEESEKKKVKNKRSAIKLSEDTTRFLKKISEDAVNKNYQFIGESLYALPDGVPELKGLRILRSGLYLGEEKKNRFEPSQALAMALKKEEYTDVIDWDCDNPNVIRYLKGETIDVPECSGKGYYLICVDGYPLGWGKVANGTLKNKYNQGWRYL